MFLFILESIGTSELILIAVVALIVLGPRKLPQMAKTIGKTMSEFRNATSEFKSTWEKEVAFEDEEKTGARANSVPYNSPVENEYSIAEIPTDNAQKNQFPAPQVRELSPAEFPENFQIKEISAAGSQSAEPNKIEKTPAADKRDWL